VTTPEGKVKARVKQILKDLNVYYAMPMGTGYGNSGVPDFLLCWHGWFIGIECKAGDNKPTALQEWNLTEIRRCGGRGYVVTESNVEELRAILEGL
jgi:pantoate kinase